MLIICGGSVDSNEYGGLLKLEKDGIQCQDVPIYLQLSIERGYYPRERVKGLREHGCHCPCNYFGESKRW